MPALAPTLAPPKKKRPSLCVVERPLSKTHRLRRAPSKMRLHPTQPDEAPLPLPIDDRLRVAEALIRRAVVYAMAGYVLIAGGLAYVFVSAGSSTLIPGAGDWTAFNAIVAALAPIGTGWGADENAGLRWDHAPHKTFATTTRIWLVADHTRGMTGVDVFINGGPACSATYMVRPETGQMEYAVDLDPEDFADGFYELRAIAYPVAGVPYVMQGAIPEAYSFDPHSMFLSCNSGASLPEPVRYASVTGAGTGDGLTRENAAPGTYLSGVMSAYQYVEAGERPNCDGLIIKLLAGTGYGMGHAGFPYITTLNRPVRIIADDGVDPASVVFTLPTTDSGNGPRARLVHFANLEIRYPSDIGSANGSSVTGGATSIPHYVFEGVRHNGVDRENGLSSLNIGGGRWFTDCTWDECSGGPTGANLVRNPVCNGIAEDVFTNGMLVINAEVDDVFTSGEGHSDLWQFGRASMFNIHCLGMRATHVPTQLIFWKDNGTIRDIFFTNYFAAQDTLGLALDDTGASQLFQGCTTVRHIVFRGVELPDQRILLFNDPTIQTFEQTGCLWRRMQFSAGDPLATAVITSPHYRVTAGSVTPGTDVSTGDPGYTNEGAGDFSKTPESVCRDRLAAPLNEVDCEGTARVSPDTVGAFA